MAYLLQRGIPLIPTLLASSTLPVVAATVQWRGMWPRMVRKKGPKFTPPQTDTVKETLYCYLLEDVPKIGAKGRVLKVKPGTFRYTLQPNKQARYATVEEITEEKLNPNASEKFSAIQTYEKIVNGLRKKTKNKKLTFNVPEGTPINITLADIIDAWRDQRRLEVNPAAINFKDNFTEYGEYDLKLNVDEKVVVPFSLYVRNREPEVKESYTVNNKDEELMLPGAVISLTDQYDPQNNFKVTSVLSMSSPRRRIETDVMKLMMSDYEVELVNDNMLEFNVNFYGPKESPYDGGCWRVRCHLPEAFPYKSPSIGFMNKIFHPNIDEMENDTRSGSVCLDVINQTWSPMYDLLNVFETFLPQLLNYPNPTDPLNGEAAALLMRHPDAYKAKVEDYVRRYATEDHMRAAGQQDTSSQDEGSELSDMDAIEDEDQLDLDY